MTLFEIKMPKTEQDQKVSFPKSNGITSTEKPWLESKNSQGYLRKVYKLANGNIYIKKTIPEESDEAYIKSLWETGAEAEVDVESDDESSLLFNQSSEKDVPQTFIDSFKTQRLAIIDFEGVFFYHYAQVTSSIKAKYMEEVSKELTKLETKLEKLSSNPENNSKRASIEAKIKAIEDKKDRDLKKIDKSFENLIKSENFEAVKKTFKQSVKESLSDSDSTIDVTKLNTLLNKRVKGLKIELDTELEAALGNFSPPGKIRETTNAFDSNVVDETETKLEDGSIFIEKIESTKITAHDKKNGPAVSKVSMIIKKTNDDGMEISETVYEGYRTSHLVSKPTKSGYAPYISAAVAIGAIVAIGISFGFPPLGFALIAVGAAVLIGIGVHAYITYNKEINNIKDTKEIINEFMNNRDKKDKPMIYNLLTSTHDNEHSLVGYNDAITNMQTARLRTLTLAQYEFNTSANKDIKDMFFVFNTPTNMKGREISLAEFPEPHDAMHLVAQSNLISMAILLYGHDHSGVYKMVDAYKKLDSEAFKVAYEELKEIQPSRINNTKEQHAQDFLYQRFKDDSGAKHAFAKDTASYVGILSQAKANIIIGCKSGNERTGGILGRIATFAASIFKKPEDTTSFNLNNTYANTRCNSASVTTVSRLDQGSDPKTEAKEKVAFSLKNLKKWVLQDHDTNKTEPAENTKIKTSGLSQLQAHKDKAFHWLGWKKRFQQMFRGSRDNELQGDEKSTDNTSPSTPSFNK